MKIKKFLIILASTHLALSTWAEDQIVQKNLTENVSYWLKENPTSDTISIQMSFIGGGYYTEEGKEGLQHVASSMLKEGSTNYSRKDFLDAVKDRSIKLAYSAGDERFQVSLSTVKRHLNEALKITFDPILQPKFEEAALEKIRLEKLAALRESQQQPEYHLSQLFKEVVAKDQPFFQRHTTEESLNSIEIKDVQDFLKTTFAQPHLEIAIVGNITAEEVDQYLKPYVEALPKEGFEKKDFIIDQHYDGKISKKFLNNIEQTTIFFAQPGITSEDDLYYAATLFGDWFGGSMNSLLFLEIREKMGLTYSIYSFLDTTKGREFFGGEMSTAHENLDKSIEAIRQLVSDVKEHNQNKSGDFYISEEKLETLKQRFKGQWKIFLETNEIVSYVMHDIQLTGFDMDHYNNYAEKIDQITLEDMHRFIEEYINPEKLSFYVVTPEN